MAKDRHRHDWITYEKTNLMVCRTCRKVSIRDKVASEKGGAFGAPKPKPYYFKTKVRKSLIRSER